MDSWGESRHVPIGISELLVLGIGEKDLSKCIPFETLKHDFHPRNDNMEKDEQCPIGEHIKCAWGMDVGKKHMRGDDLRVCLLQKKTIDLSDSFTSPEVANNQENKEEHCQRILFFKLSLTCCHKETFLISQIIFGHRWGSCQACKWAWLPISFNQLDRRLREIGSSPWSWVRKQRLLVNARPWRPGELVQYKATDAQEFFNLQVGECMQAGIKLMCLIL